MKKNVKETKKKKETGKVMKWCNDHIVQILMGVLMAGSGAAGLIIGKDYFYNKGYANGLNEFRANHVNTAKMIMNDAAEEAAFTALNLVRGDANMYKTLLDDPDTVLKKVGEIYGDSDYVKVMKKRWKPNAKGSVEIYISAGPFSFRKNYTSYYRRI